MTKKHEISGKFIRKGSILALLFVFCVIFGNFLFYSFTVVFYPFEVDIIEGGHYAPLLRILNGESPYLDFLPFESEYVTLKVTPLFLIFQSVLVMILGMDLFSGRIISVSASIIIGILIFLIVKKRTGKLNLSLLSLILFYSSYVIFQISSEIRVDVLAAMFSLLGIYFIQNYKERKNFYLSIFFFILSIFTKQSFLAAPLAAFTYLLIKNRKFAIRFMALFLVILASLAFIIQIISNGNFLTNILAQGKLIPSVSFTYERLKFIFPMLILGFIYSIKNKKDIFSLYFISSVIFLLIQLMNFNSWINYLYEITIVGSILCPLLLLAGNMKFRSFIIILLLLQFFIYVDKEPRITSYFLSYEKYPPLVNRHSDEIIFNYVNNAKGNVYVDNRWFSRLANKKVSPEFWSIIELKKLGLLEEEDILNYFKKENYSMIIYYKNDRIPTIKKLDTWIKENYKLIDEIYWTDQALHQEKWKVYKLKSVD